MSLYKLSTAIYKVCVVTIYAFFAGYVYTKEPIVAIVITAILFFCWARGVFP